MISLHSILIYRTMKVTKSSIIAGGDDRKPTNEHKAQVSMGNAKIRAVFERFTSLTVSRRIQDGQNIGFHSMFLYWPKPEDDWKE